MSHKSEEQAEPVGTCPCGHELLLYEGKLLYHDCTCGDWTPFDLIQYTKDILGVTDEP